MKSENRPLSFLLLLLTLSMPVSAEWDITEKPGELRVANGKIGVVVKGDTKQAVQITLIAADKAGKWQETSRTLRPDFTKNPEANKFYDTTVTPHRYQANDLFTEFSVSFRSDKQVKIKMSGSVQKKIVSEQILTLDHDSSILHVDVTAIIHEPKLDYFISSWEFLPPGAPDFVHSPTAKKDDKRSGPAADQVIGDHAFHSPAIVLQKGGLYTCMVPDLAMINAHLIQSPDARRTQAVMRGKFSSPIIDEYYTMPTALDLNSKSGLTAQPVLSYGMLDFLDSRAKCDRMLE